MVAFMQIIARRFRALAFRCAHALRLRHDEAEAAIESAVQQDPCADLKPGALEAKPDLAAMDGAATQAAEPLPQSAAPKQEGTAVASQACLCHMPMRAVTITMHARCISRRLVPSLLLWQHTIRMSA